LRFNNGLLNAMIGHLILVLCCKHLNGIKR
jgi:hypothetical protein